MVNLINDSVAKFAKIALPTAGTLLGGFVVIKGTQFLVKTATPRRRTASRRRRRR